MKASFRNCREVCFFSICREQDKTASICKYMMKNEEIIPNIINYLGQTAIHYADEKGHFEIAIKTIYLIIMGQNSLSCRIHTNNSLWHK